MVWLMPLKCNSLAHLVHPFVSTFMYSSKLVLITEDGSYVDEILAIFKSPETLSLVIWFKNQLANNIIHNVI